MTDKLTVRFAADGNFTKYGQTILKKAIRRVTQRPVDFVPAQPGDGVIGFGVDSEFTTLSPKSVSFVPSAESILERTFRAYFGFPKAVRKVPGGVDPSKVLYFDIETHSADERWNLPPREFFRMGQYAWGPYGDVVITVDYDEMISVIREADLVVGHNIHSFDLSVLFGTDSTEPLEMARDGKVFDTFVYAITAFPAPDRYINANGKVQLVNGPGQIMKWLSLDNLAFQFDVQGKIGDLKAMAKKYGGFCHIPLVLTEFIDYARQDVVALQELTHELLSFKDVEPYDWREQKFAGICAQISRNGFKVDIEKATARRDELARRKQELMDRLVEEYDFPTEGKQPWRSTVGKEAIFKILEDVGISPDTVPEWKLTATGNYSLGGEVLLEITKGTAAQELGESLAELMGQRSLSQLALDSVQLDGFTHPNVTALQRSGRLSTTSPGLTIWSARGGKSIEKSYFIPDTDDELLIELDFSQADARIVAAYSGDENFAKRFEEGSDAHMITAYAVWGEEVDSNPTHYRELAKACIAEGQQVLTNLGLVPIEHVTKSHLVWDGCRWVNHEGVIYQGKREVFEYEGLTATRDHQVFVRSPDGTLRTTDFETAARCRVPIERTGEGTQELRVGSSHGRTPSVEAFNTPEDVRVVSLDEVFGVHEGGVASQVKSLTGVGSGVLEVLTGKEDSVPQLATNTPDGRETEVREPKETGVSELRGEGDSVQLRLGERGVQIHLPQHSPVGPNIGNRPNRHERTLRTGKHSDGYPQGESGESKELGIERVQSGILAVPRGENPGSTREGVVSGTSYRECEGNGTDEAEELQTDRRTVKVYDILNAGPLHRFTVSDRLVSNCGHAYAYRSGPKTISETSGQPLAVAQKFVQEMNAAYPKVIAWQERVTRLGEVGYVVNDWGRKMIIEAGRSYTQSPAMFGQSGTRELMVDALIRMLYADERLIPMLKAQVHDALVFSVPKDHLGWAVEMIRKCMETEWQPADGSGQLIKFPVSAGTPATDWEKAGH